MKVAAMQPYFFPYLGYYQLISHVDVFIILDDVNYFKKGFINRNYLNDNGQKLLFTVSIEKASQNKQINELKISDNQEKTLRQIQHLYQGSKRFPDLWPVITDCLTSQSKSLDDVCIQSMKPVFSMLGSPATIIKASDIKSRGELRSEDRIIDLCLSVGATEYINLPGGKGLYSSDSFFHHGMKLSFIEPEFREYTVKNSKYMPGLSFIDVFMNCDNENIISQLSNYRIVSAEN